MPYCENCKSDAKSEDLHKDLETNQLLCSDCASERKLVSEPSKQEDLVLGREFDYEFSYNRKEGIRAGVRLGGAKLSLEVSQQELTRTFGPEQ